MFVWLDGGLVGCFWYGFLICCSWYLVLLILWLCWLGWLVVLFLLSCFCYCWGWLLIVGVWLVGDGVGWLWDVWCGGWVGELLVKLLFEGFLVLLLIMEIFVFWYWLVLCLSVKMICMMCSDWFYCGVEVVEWLVMCCC